MASEGSNSNILNTSRRNVAENQKRKAVLMAAALAGAVKNAFEAAIGLDEPPNEIGGGM